MKIKLSLFVMAIASFFFSHIIFAEHADEISLEHRYTGLCEVKVNNYFSKDDMWDLGYRTIGSREINLEIDSDNKFVLSEYYNSEIDNITTFQEESSHSNSKINFSNSLEDSLLNLYEEHKGNFFVSDTFLDNVEQDVQVTLYNKSNIERTNPRTSYYDKIVKTREFNMRTNTNTFRGEILEEFINVSITESTYYYLNNFGLNAVKVEQNTISKIFTSEDNIPNLIDKRITTHDCLYNDSSN